MPNRCRSESLCYPSCIFKLGILDNIRNYFSWCRVQYIGGHLIDEIRSVTKHLMSLKTQENIMCNFEISSIPGDTFHCKGFYMHSEVRHSRSYTYQTVTKALITKYHMHIYIWTYTYRLLPILERNYLQFHDINLTIIHGISNEKLHSDMCIHFLSTTQTMHMINK